jgi:hypothetical protein
VSLFKSGIIFKEKNFFARAKIRFLKKPFAKTFLKVSKQATSFVKRNIKKNKK